MYLHSPVIHHKMLIKKYWDWLHQLFSNCHWLCLDVWRASFTYISFSAMPTSSFEFKNSKYFLTRSYLTFMLGWLKLIAWPMGPFPPGRTCLGKLSLLLDTWDAPEKKCQSDQEFFITVPIYAWPPHYKTISCQIWLSGKSDKSVLFDCISHSSLLLLLFYQNTQGHFILYQ